MVKGINSYGMVEVRLIKLPMFAWMLFSREEH